MDAAGYISLCITFPALWSASNSALAWPTDNAIGSRNVSSIKTDACSTKYAEYKSYLYCSKKGEIGVQTGFCYFDTATSQYRSCYKLCDHTKGHPSKQADCNRLCPNFTGYDICTPSTTAVIYKIWDKILIAVGVVISVVSIVFLILFLHAWRRSKKRKCWRCKGQLTCCLCRIANRLCCGKYRIESCEARGLSQDADTGESDQTSGYGTHGQ